MNASHAKSDVVVIGAGPAGSAAAIEAALAGARVTLLDRARFPREKTCGDALSNHALALLEALGVPLAHAPRARVDTSTAIFPDGSRVGRNYESPGAIITRYELDRRIRERAEAAGATVIEGVRVRSISASDAGAVAHADRRSWQADVVIAADGPASVAWSARGRRAPRGPALALAATAYYEGVTPDRNAESEHYFEHDLGCGYGWIFPAVSGVANVGVYQRADRYQSGGKHLGELLADFVARHPERFAQARLVGDIRSWPLPLAGARPFAGSAGVLACGDAARLVDPLTGEGIWHALASGRLAARAALGALGGGGVDRRALARYALALSTQVGWPAASRRLLQSGIDQIVRHQLYERSATRRVLAWGFQNRALEISKS